MLKEGNMKSIIILILLFISSNIYSQNISNEIDWTFTNTIYESTFFALTFIDVWTTDTLLNHTYKNSNTHRIGERNPLFGTDKPSSKRLWTCFSGLMIGHIGLMIIFPNPYRKYLQIASILIESIVIYDNYNRCGLKFKHSF
jgi:hypothetical protein